MANVDDWPSCLLRWGAILGIIMFAAYIDERAIYIQDPSKSISLTSQPREILYPKGELSFYVILLAFCLGELPFAMTSNRKISVGFMIGSIVLLFTGLTLSILGKSGEPVSLSVRFFLDFKSTNKFI